MSETKEAPIGLEVAVFDWDSVGKKGDSYTKEEREKLDQQYEKTLKQITANEIVEGKVVAKNSKEVVVNIGYKSDGVVQLSEFRYNPESLNCNFCAPEFPNISISAPVILTSSVPSSSNSIDQSSLVPR